MTKQEFATLVVAMQEMYGENFIGTGEALDVWYALMHDLDYQILSKALQQYMLTNKFKPTVAELREIYTELVSPTISDWSEGWEKVSKAIGHYGMYQEEAAMESFDEVTLYTGVYWSPAGTDRTEKVKKLPMTDRQQRQCQVKDYTERHADIGLAAGVIAQ